MINTNSQVKKTSLSIIIFFLAVFSVCLNSCGSSVIPNISEKPKTPEELRAELKRQELSTPLSYIEDKHVLLYPKQKKIRNGGLFRDPEYAPDGAVIEGDFISKAALAKFKDVVVKVSFYSQTKTLIEEKSYVIYQYIEPNSTKHFSIRVDQLPGAYKEFRFAVTGATPVYD